MRFIFVRHGHPDYKKDCLTELGHLQAKAVAERLKDEEIKEIYASPQGRACETAGYIANKFQLDIIKLDFMHEMKWGSINDTPIYENGHPWKTADNMAAKGQTLLSSDWTKEEPFCNNKVINSYKTVSEGIDILLEDLGFKREGEFYRVCKNNNDTIVLASHAGSSGAAIAHIFNLPLPFITGVMAVNFTSVTTVKFEGEEGSLITPKIEVYNDAKHIENLKVENVFG